MTTVNAKLVFESKTTTDWGATVPTAGRFVVELDDGDGVTPVGLYYSNGTDDIGTLTNLVGAGSDSVSSADITEIVVLTQAAYDAIGTPDAATLYVIVG